MGVLGILFAIIHIIKASWDEGTPLFRGFLVALALLIIIWLFILPAFFPAQTSQGTNRMLPEEFCYTLRSDVAQDICIKDAKGIEDDPRVRSLYRNTDFILWDLQDILECINGSNEMILQWDEASEPDELKGLYVEYYTNSQRCSGKIDSANTNLDKAQGFLEYHKQYLDSINVDTESSMDSITRLKGEYSVMISTIQENFDVMSFSISLTEQEQQDLDSFQGNLSVMADELE